jgi:hypothetical protein
MSTRRPRRERPKCSGRLTARDIELLATVGKLRVATTRQLAALYFGDPSTASRRLAVLLGMGLVSVTVQDLSRPNAYVLSRKGQEELIRAGIDPEDLFVARIDRRTALDHVVALGDLHVALTLELADRGVTAVALSFDHEIRRLLGPGGTPLVPDLFVACRAADDVTRAVAFEIDMAEESAGYFGRTKGDASRTLLTAKVPFFGAQVWRPVVVAPSAARLRHLGRELVAAGVGTFWFGTTFEALNTEGVLGAAYLSADELGALGRGQAFVPTRSLADELGLGDGTP